MRCVGGVPLRYHRKTRHIEALAFRKARKTRDVTIWGSEVHECHKNAMLYGSCHKKDPYVKCDALEILQLELIAKRDT